MAVDVHADGRIERGRWAEFLAAVPEWLEYRRDHGWSVPRLLEGLSGEMNSVRMIFSYDDLAAYEREEAVVGRDREYARIAMKLPFEGSITFTIYREAGGR